VLFTTGLPTVRPTEVDAVELSWEHDFAALPFVLRVSALNACASTCRGRNLLDSSQVQTSGHEVQHRVLGSLTVAF